MIIEQEKSEPEWFGEWAFYENEEEREEIVTYLTLWVKYFPRRLGLTVINMSELIANQPDPLIPRGTVGIKIEVVLKGAHDN